MVAEIKISGVYNESHNVTRLKVTFPEKTLQIN